MVDSRLRGPLVIHIGHEELVIRRRYEVLSILNDMLIAVWFIAGSAMFFDESLSTAAIWMFLIGSIQFGIRPVIRLSRHVHLRRFRTPEESDQDF